MWTTQALCDAAQLCFITVMRRLMQHTKRFFVTHGKDEFTRENDAYFAMLQKRDFDEK